MNKRLTFSSIILGVLLMGIWGYMVDFEQMFNVLKKMRISLMLPLLILFVLMYFLRSIRWKIILSPIEEITIIESFNLCMINYFINFLIPVHAGELTKSYLLKEMKRTPISRSLLTVYGDKMMDMMPIFFLLAATPFLEKQINHIIYLLSGILSLLLFFFILFLYAVVKKKTAAEKCLLKAAFFLPERIRLKLKNFMGLFSEGILSVTRGSGRLLEIAGLTMLSLVTHCAFMWLFFYSFSINLPLFTLFVGYLLLNASFILPAPPGFAGTLELSFVFIFSYIFGYEINIVSAIAASSHIFVASLLGLFGFLALTSIGTKLKTVIIEPTKTF